MPSKRHTGITANPDLPVGVILRAIKKSENPKETHMDTETPYRWNNEP